MENRMELQNLKGKTAVVTGASSGIGQAAARLLIDEGVRVIITARRKDRLDALAKELGNDAIVVPADLADATQVASLFDAVREHFDGGLDLLFNNAGLGYNGRFETSKPEEWEKTIDANLYGVLRCTHAAIPLLRGRTGAMISTVSSVGGLYGMAGWSVYNATKWAVIGFCDAIRKELGPDGIRVSVIEPGAVWTEWGFNLDPEKQRKGREELDALKSHDVARALVYTFAQPPSVNVQEVRIQPVKQIQP
jgi:NADP-dependent 3-hydroxy acid dehydrogenase YdfG